METESPGVTSGLGGMGPSIAHLFKCFGEKRIFQKVRHFRYD